MSKRVSTKRSHPFAQSGAVEERTAAPLSVTHEPLCSVAGCPEPTNPDWHRCHVCGKLEVQHHHWPKKGMGGRNLRSQIVAALCQACHDKTDTIWGNGILDLPTGERLYRIWSVADNKTILERVLGARPGRAPAQETPPEALPATPAPLEVIEPPLTPYQDKTLTSWCSAGMQLVYMGLRLKGATDDWRWQVGDWCARGEEIVGEGEVYQYYEPFVKEFGAEAVRQYRWVAEQVAPVTRVTSLPYTFHRMVAALPEPKQQELLAIAAEQELTTRQFHGLVADCTEREPESAESGCKHRWLCVVQRCIFCGEER